MFSKAYLMGGLKVWTVIKTERVEKILGKRENAEKPIVFKELLQNAKLFCKMLKHHF